MRKLRLLTALTLALALCLCASADKAFTPLPWEEERSPIAPDAAHIIGDYAGYHDDSIDITTEWVERFGTPILLTRVKIADASQFRTGLAAKFPSTTSTKVTALSQRVNAVLAFTGDSFITHNDGIVYRCANRYRIRPNAGRDTLIIDDRGDFHILTPTPTIWQRQEAEAWWEGYVREQGLTPIHVFCFGPGLVIDGEEIPSTDTHIADIGREQKYRRIAVGQTGPLEYLIIATNGPEDARGQGLTIMELADVCYEFGCVQAYNLDGGLSATVVLAGQKIFPRTNPRNVADYLWFATLDGEREGT